MMERRQFLKSGLASMVAFSSSTVMAKASSAQHQPAKFVWVMLRGALDPLHTVVPRNNKELAKLRPTLYKDIKDKLLPLNKDFGLHPSLKNLHSWYQQNQMMPVVAVSSGYPARSHFSGQDYLESGLVDVDVDNGWLARAIHQKHTKALAVSNAMPVSLRGASLATTWYPNGLKSADNQLYSQLLTMYQDDEKLLASLNKGLSVKKLLKENQQLKSSGKFQELCRSGGQLLAKSQDVDCAMLEVGSWDTHNRQVPRLERQLTMLDDGLAELKKSLGKQWQHTVVVVATEFGRTAKENGTQGTDHGTGSALLLTGGAVNGGQVLGQWPGLKQQQLFENRDLQPTSNSFDWIASLMAQHWQLSESQLNKVFPQGVSLTANKLINSKVA